MTNIEFLSFLKAVLKKKTYYMWGTYGGVITEQLLARKAKQYPARYSAARQAALRGVMDGSSRGCDCAGLIKWFLWSGGNSDGKITYNSDTDNGTTGFFDAAKVKGKISTLPETAGIAVHKSGHVGIYIGNGKVIECTLGSRGDGVVMSELKKGGWTHWYKLPYITYRDGYTGEVQAVKNPESSDDEEKKTPLYAATISARLKKFFADRFNLKY